MPTDALHQFLALCRDGDMARLQLTRPPADGGATRLQLRPVELKGGPHWQAVWRHPTKDLTENWPLADAPARLAQLLEAGWASAALWTAQGHWQLDRQRKGDWRLVRHPGGQRQPDPAHDRAKPKALSLDHPVWSALGLATPGRGGQAQPVPAMARKWKQINHFVALFEQALQRAGLQPTDQPLRVADFGCGRAYLTFAVALHLRQLGWPHEVLGVELRDDLVAQTEALAREQGLDGLHFAQGDVGHQAVRALDVMIALHACDTATDIALHHGLRAGARVILCAPCCHKQLRGQLQPPDALRPLFKHGVHLGQEAEMLTDGLRALLLETRGYEAQVIEFVALEHTQKNKMIVAVQRPQRDARREAEALRQVQALKAFWSVREQRLEDLLGAP